MQGCLGRGSAPAALAVPGAAHLLGSPLRAALVWASQRFPLRCQGAVPCGPFRSAALAARLWLRLCAGLGPAVLPSFSVTSSPLGMRWRRPAHTPLPGNASQVRGLLLDSEVVSARKDGYLKGAHVVVGKWAAPLLSLRRPACRGPGRGGGGTARPVMQLPAPAEERASAGVLAVLQRRSCCGAGAMPAPATNSGSRRCLQAPPSSLPRRWRGPRPCRWCSTRRCWRWTRWTPASR